MANLINALTTGVGGLETIADASGSFSFQSDGSTIATVTSSGFSVTGTFDAGSLQVGGSDVVVDTDIGSTVQAYDADTTKNDVANTFTANQTINGNLTVDTNTLYVDSTNNRVGIGTSSPSSGLEVYGTDAASGRIEVTRNTSSMYLGSSGAGGYIQTPDANPLLFYTNAAERMVINSSGNVGIGTSSPLTELNVQGGIGAASPTELTTRANAMFSLSASATNTRLYQGVESGTTVWLQAQNSDNSAKAIAINPVGGNVGIGISSPSATLQVNGASLLGSPATFYVGDDGGSLGAFLNQTAALPIRFNTNGAERMRIDSSGNVGIGTSSPASKLDVTGTVTATSFTGSASGLTGIPAPAALTTASGSAPSYSARAWVNFNGTGTVAIRASGNVSSITDNSTGDYTINFTTAMPDTNYAIIGSAQGLASGSDVVHFGANGYSGSPIIAPATTNCKVGTFAYSGAGADSAYVMVGIFR